MALPDYADEASDVDAEPDEQALNAPAIEPFSLPRELYTGVCIGGPWDGTTVESRFPRGFLLIHMPTRKLWIYDMTADESAFKVRGTEPLDLRDDGSDNRWRAADEADYDIRVMDPETTVPTTVCEAL